MASWLHGFMASWLHGFMASWLHGFMASWLHGFMASISGSDGGVLLGLPIVAFRINSHF
jgi:hypothetical protein